MKKLFSITFLALLGQMAFAEFAIIDDIVYELDLNKQTAMVLNFQTNTEDVCDVTIPPAVVYKHETFTVTSLGYNKPQGYDFIYSYDKARINIEHLDLPNTLEVIYTDAFTGMARLKELIIPESVELLIGMKRDGWLNSWDDCPVLGRDNKEEFPRIRRITVLGTPTCKREEHGNFYYYTINSRYRYDLNNKKIEEPLDITNYDYILKVANTIAGIKSLDDPSTKLCPNLWRFSMPAAERKIGPIKQCYTELRQLSNSYNEQLKKQPYFDGSQITYKLVYKGDLSQLTKDRDSIKAAINEQYNRLVNGQMENNLRKKDLDLYIKAYQKQHPECAQGIDSIRFEYRCEALSKQNSIVLLFIEHSELPQSCRDSLYQQSRALFSDKTEFDEIYNRTSVDSLQLEIKFRAELRPWLDKFIDLVQKNPDAKLQGMTAAKEGSVPYRLNAYLRRFQPVYSTQNERPYLNYCYSEALNTIFWHNNLIKAEYAKNGHYFANREAFFNAYIAPDYKKQLKASKSNH